MLLSSVLRALSTEKFTLFVSSQSKSHQNNHNERKKRSGFCFPADSEGFSTSFSLGWFSIVSEMGTNRILRCLLFLLCNFGLFPFGRAIWLSLPPSGTKCVSEEVQTNVVVLGDYIVIPDDGASHVPKLSAKVTSPYGSVLHRTQNVTGGQFSFTTTQAGSYMACFWLDNHDPHQPGASVNVDWKIGIAAKDWDSIARKERIQGIELELRKLEGAVDTIHENLLYLKNREAEMREVNEITNTRVARCSIMSLGICTGVSVFQLWYLRRFFQKKKLI
ncbi:transmembrane emp24 domain-containing protein p24delta3 [Cinnamomum micranthum f. kanehirae]|uniref:Transmembrane emp24 domain-containing protein p24delta3 n=1 Tax=Cinnamomum micranthum f. kanehirae TaxID=337451 RepID=A0A3S3MX45_9MAGN|nr:transmembrane emp24 domain-containing protein p24delta3 [Cinnamomum micranthum f. kanehirae]